MRKLLLIAILLGSVVLAGCGQQQGLSQNELFEKKQECAGYRNKIETTLKTNYTSYDLQEIFYSPSKNSCLYTYTRNMDPNLRQVVDYFTNESLAATTVPTSYSEETSSVEKIKLWNEDQMNFDKKIKELKGE